MSYTKSRPRRASGSRRYILRYQLGNEVIGAWNVNAETWTDQATYGENPRWRAQIKAGVQAGTTLVGTKATARAWPMYVVERFYYNTPILNAARIDHKLTEGRRYLAIPSWAAGTSPSMVSANNRALANYVEAIRKIDTPFQGGIFLGELSETVRMLRSPLKSLRRGLSDYLGALKKRRKGIKGRPASIKKQRKKILADTWLEYSFGFAPLVNDVQDAYDLLTGPIPRDVQNIRGVGIDSTSSESTISFSAGTPPYPIHRVRTVKKAIVIYHGAYSTERARRFESRSLGLDLSNFAPTAWELIPWSFLVDYFTNVGDIISAASLARRGLRWTMRTEIQAITAQTIGNHFVLDSGGSGTTVKLAIALPGRAVSTWSSVNRAPYTGSLIPTLQFEVPGFGLKWLNMAALSASARSLTPFY